MASTSKAAVVPAGGKAAPIPDPPHYVALPSLTPQSKKEKRRALESKQSASADEDKSEALKSLRQRKAWETALGPAKNIPMQGFMMYMSGSTIQIFSAMAVIMLVKTSIGGALSVNNVFQAFESPKSATPSGSTDATEGDPYALLPQKIAFVVCQGLLFCVALYKVHTMGLLPTHSSDWLSFVEPNTAVEWSTIGRMF